MLKLDGIHYAVWTHEVTEDRRFLVGTSSGAISNPEIAWDIESVSSANGEWAGAAVDPIFGLIRLQFPGELANSGYGKWGSFWAEVNGSPLGPNNIDYARIATIDEWEVYPSVTAGGSYSLGTANAAHVDSFGGVFFPYLVYDLVGLDRTDPLLIQREEGWPLYWLDLAVDSEASFGDVVTGEEWLEDEEGNPLSEVTWLASSRGNISLFDLSLIWDRSTLTFGNNNNAIAASVITPFDYSARGMYQQGLPIWLTQSELKKFIRRWKLLSLLGWMMIIPPFERQIWDTTLNGWPEF